MAANFTKKEEPITLLFTRSRDESFTVSDIAPLIYEEKSSYVDATKDLYKSLVQGDITCHYELTSICPVRYKA